MPKTLGSILKDLASIKLFLSILIGLGGTLLAFANTFGGAPAAKIVGGVLAVASLLVTIISAYSKGFGTGSASLHRG
jgi:hypothetical protein